MAAPSRPAERFALRALTAADAACNRLYGWQANPLYQSGTIVFALLLVLLATGLWLIFFYRVGAPYASVAGLTANPWIGNWVRGLHRYASDAAVIATLAHAFRMYAQGRSWGPRALAWMTGVLLLLVVFICGWTGYVMVWDTFGQLLAREGARMLDTLPVLSEPTSRAFSGERPIPSVFFFLNLFAHVGLPLALFLGLWLHVSRLARPTILPPRPLLWSMTGVLIVLSVVRPMAMAPEASPFMLPASVPADWFFAFWLPLSRSLPAGAALMGAGLTTLALLFVPFAPGRRGAASPPPSRVDENICTGCRQCSIDCPYEAITMLPRTDGHADEVARVTADLCVSCGICAGSCAPMGVGPEGRTGRDQLLRVRAFVERAERQAGEVVVVCCERGAARFGRSLEADGAALYAVDCAGNLHTSAIELLLRGGAGGVLILACPPRDCWNREGPRWLFERVYHDREAELQPRVDRRRVRVAYANASESHEAREALREFAAHVATLGATSAEPSPEVETVCEPAPIAEGS
jgi:coenzyme F420-reducing hydrogenase delta subunit/Pyruvate/2-oxoacid:ferredoxin oxidoreductase delta subunit